MCDDDLVQRASDADVGCFDQEHADIVFDRQDSGCVSYRVSAAGRSWFVKTARNDAARRSLRNAVEFHRRVRHPAIVAPVRMIEEPALVLISPWVEGTVLNHATVDGSDRRGLDRFRTRPLPRVEASISEVLDAHLVVAEAGFTSVDFYDGCLLDDAEGERIRLIDLDEYRPAPTRVEGDRQPGSSSYMAPEEWRRGSVIDERTMVFHLGRMIGHLLADPTAPADPARWRGTGTQADLVRAATRERPADRIASVADLVETWCACT